MTGPSQPGQGRRRLTLMPEAGHRYRFSTDLRMAIRVLHLGLARPACREAVGAERRVLIGRIEQDAVRYS